MRDLFALFSWRPARIAGLDRDGRGPRGSLSAEGGPIRPGAGGSLAVFDPSLQWVVDPSREASRSREHPLGGLRLTGKIRHTVFAGEVVVRDGAAAAMNEAPGPLP